MTRCNSTTVKYNRPRLLQSRLNIHTQDTRKGANEFSPFSTRRLAKRFHRRVDRVDTARASGPACGIMSCQTGRQGTCMVQPSPLYARRFHDDAGEGDQSRNNGALRLPIFRARTVVYFNHDSHHPAASFRSTNSNNNLR